MHLFHDALVSFAERWDISMKKILCVLMVLSCLFVEGCENEFAYREYNSSEKIAQEADRYAKVGSIFNPIEGGYSLTVSKFDGRETVWSGKVKESREIEIDFYFTLSAGQAKVVHVDAEGNVITIMECVPETVTDDVVTKKVILTSGENRLKIVGYDCEDVELKILFEEP